MEKTGSDFVRMSFKRLKSHFWEEVRQLSLPAVGWTKQSLIQLPCEIFMFLRKKYLCILERWLLGKKCKGNLWTLCDSREEQVREASVQPGPGRTAPPWEWEGFHGFSKSPQAWFYSAHEHWKLFSCLALISAPAVCLYHWLKFINYVITG